MLVLLELNELSPITLLAYTANVYVVPAESPVTVIAPEDVVAVLFPGLLIAVKEYAGIVDAPAV
jgi:hypothetical protein